MKLTAKQETFAQGVASGMTAGDAYRQAYDADKMKPESIRVNARKLAKRTPVALRVKELQAPAVIAVQETVTVDATRTLLEDACIAASDIRKLFTPDGDLKPPHEWDDGMAASVASVEVVALFGQGADGKGQIGHTKKVKLWDKGAAIDRLNRRFGAYEKDNKQKGVLDGTARNKLKNLLEALNGFDGSVG